MGRILLPNGQLAGAASDFFKQEGMMLRHIKASMDSLRLIGIVPNFDNFKEHEAWWKCSRRWTNREKTKYKAWWNAIYRLQRDKNDHGTVSLIIGFLLQEKARRFYAKEPPLEIEKLGKFDDAHVERVKKYVREHYELIDPDLGVVA